MTGARPPAGEFARLLRVAFPLALYYLTEVAMGLTDMVIVGRLGSDELAAVGLSAGIIIEAIVVCFALLSVVGVLSSHALGSGDRDRVSAIVGQGFWVALSLAVLVVALTAWLPELFVVTGQDPEVVRLSRDYLAWMIWVTPLALCFVVLRNFLTVLSRTEAIACVTVPAVGLNLLLNYLLVFGVHGFPEMGVAGAGLASIIVNLLMVLSLFVYVGLNRYFHEFRIVTALWKIDAKIWASILKLGAPAGMTAFLEGGLFAVVGIMMGTLGADWLAANEILFHIIPLAFVVALAIGESAAVRIAYHSGAGNIPMTRWIARVALAMGACVMLSAAFVLWLFPEQVVALFIDVEAPENARVVAIATALTSIAAIFQLFDGLQVVAAWCLRGLRDTFIPMWIASAGYWLCGLGSGYWFGFVQGYGATGVWWGLAAGLTMTSLMLSARLYLLLRKRGRERGEAPGRAAV
jgi:MATE family multidrug resistance protein